MSLPSIMIVDDNEMDRYLLKRYINKSNLAHKVFEAENGEEALALLNDYSTNREKYPEKFPPILIFLDINMPIMNGFEFLEEFKKIRNNPDVYESIVLTMFTSSASEEDRVKALNYDFVKDYIVKMPNSSEDLKKTLAKHFPNQIH